MGDLVKIVECPRDAWQGLPLQLIATGKVKVDLSSRKLVAAGFHAH
jgi:hypothetical protein